METKLATAFYIGEHRCYGYRLRPFCLLHSLQLEALASPVITGRGEIKAADLIIAAQICATHEVLTGFSRARLRRIWYDRDNELARFDSYLDNCETGPDLFSRPDSGGGSLKAPWQQVVVTYLIRETSIRRDEAWRMPLGQALWDFHAAREQVADKSMIRTEEDAESEAAQLADEMDNAATWEDRRAAFAEMRERIGAGTWPLDESGNPIPFSHENLRPV